MNRIARTFACLALVSAGCATLPVPSDFEVAQRRAADDALVASAKDPMYRSSEGFQYTRWGQTLAEVQAEYPAAQPVPEGLQMTGQLGSQPAEITFAFENDKLAEVTARTAPDRFDVLQLELASKYGAPTTKDDPKQVALDKLAAADQTDAGEVFTWLFLDDAQRPVYQQNQQIEANQREFQRTQLLATPMPRADLWVQAETRIELSSKPADGAVVARYQSRALADALTAQRDAAAFARSQAAAARL